MAQEAWMMTGYVDTEKKRKGKEAPRSPGAQAVQTKATLTHLDKVYWPKEGISKGDLIAYYDSIANWILPYLKDRPQSLHRFPDGIEGMNFYQKDYDTALPAFVKSRNIYSESNKEELTWLLCQNRDSLLYLANLGCIEMNVWNSRIAKLNNPDYLVIDLDPDGNAFDEVVALARQTRKLLDKYEAASYCKTSGQSGLHVYVPLAARYTYDEARQFGLMVVRELHALSDGNTSLERSPAKRRGLIYLDYLQNRNGQTLASAYSVRPWPGATVSTPLKWEEVKKGLDPGKFTIFSIGKRLDKVGDLWEPVLGPGADIKRALAKMQA